MYRGMLAPLAVVVISTFVAAACDSSSSSDTPPANGNDASLDAPTTETSTPDDAGAAMPLDAANDAPTDPLCTEPADSAALRVTAAEGNDNPRPFTQATCAVDEILAGVVVVDLGNADPNLLDGVIPICAKIATPGTRVIGNNSDLDANGRQPGATEVDLRCPNATDRVVGITYEDGTLDHIQAFGIVCRAANGTETVIGTPDLPSPAANVVRCPDGRLAVGTVYKDATDDLSDAAESAGIVCRPATCLQ